ncbi:STE-12 alpha [Coprinopsis cinerea AmutBmut pab1-1]|nr:STE-12 alpha [Coprinopsis cinerea AmutBmut pab1-1]
MPRVESKPHTSLHQISPYPTHYLSESTSSAAPSSTTSSSTADATSNKSRSASSGTTTSPPPKKKHVCPTCERAFTTSGHLARHTRIHTGERNHKCPFPGCETRCSRQDNLQQHYRIHLSPGSRRAATRSRAKGASKVKAASVERPKSPSPVSKPSTPPVQSLHPSPPLTPPILEPSRLYPSALTPPDSPPPLAQATLPATAQLHHETTSRYSSASSSPHTPYSSYSHGLSATTDSSGLADNQYGYRPTTATTYQDQSSSLHFGYVNTAPPSVCHTPVNNGPPSFSAYPSPHQDYVSQPALSSSLQHLQSRDPSPVTFSSRHSFSSNSSHGYPYSVTGTITPPSPASTHSIASYPSGPSTPTYPAYNDNQVYPSSLAPAHDRYPRRDDRSQPYIHHPQPLTSDYSYHPSLGMGQGVWKSDTMRTSLGIVQ